MSSKNDLAAGKIGKLLFSLAVPSIIAQLVNVLYNIVDRIFIGKMADSTIAMAGLSTALPLVTLIMAFTQLVGVGGAPLCAIKLGEKNQDGAEEIMTNSFSALIISGVLITITILLFQTPLLTMFGASAETLKPASEYITIYALGTVFVQIAFGMNAYINTQGFAKIGMSTVLIGAIINIILDPVFIFGFGMGVKGAALATIISQGVSALWVLQFLFSKNSTIKIRKQYIIPKLKVLIPIVSLGVSPFVMASTESLLQISFINQLSVYGGTLAVASMAILNSIWQFISMPMMGLCQGAQPIMSYNYGAKNYERVRQTFKLTFKCCLGLSFTFGGLFIIFATPLVSVFTSDPTTIRFASWALRIYVCGGMVMGAQNACQQSFMALGQAKISLLMALTRKVFLLIPLIYVLPIIMGNSGIAMSLAQPVADLVQHAGKVFAIYFAEPVSDTLASLITTLMFVRFYRKHLSKTALKHETEQ